METIAVFRPTTTKTAGWSRGYSEDQDVLPTTMDNLKWFFVNEDRHMPPVRMKTLRCFSAIEDQSVLDS